MSSTVEPTVTDGTTATAKPDIQAPRPPSATIKPVDPIANVGVSKHEAKQEPVPKQNVDELKQQGQE